MICATIAIFFALRTRSTDLLPATPSEKSVAILGLQKSWSEATHRGTGNESKPAIPEGQRSEP
jgi:hypothetical protein